MPSPLARAPSEPALRYEYRSQTLTLDNYLARNPATGLLVVRGDTILIERYQHRARARRLTADTSTWRSVDDLDRLYQEGEE